jgi:glycosyltransferase involved in cell wall biosynthesis
MTHIVVTGNAAGTERYVCQVATLQSAAGHQVTVVGGDPDYMRSTLPSTAVWRPGETPRRALRSLLTGGGQDVVHAHLSAADLVAVVAAPCHGAKVISTRHIAKARGGSRPVRLMFRMLQRRISVDVCMSEQVGRAVGGRATVLPAGVRPDVRLASAGSRVVVMAQRLELDKACDVALAGWAESGLAALGWTLVICGDGSQRERLQRLVARSGTRGVQWRGWVEDLLSTLLESAALLAPCPVESYGLAVVEAMSVGLPVVAAAGGGHLETVGRCPESLLFAPGDVQDCARQLAVLAAMTPTALAGYGAALQQLQRSRFDIADHVARLDDVYRSVLDRGPVG